MFFHGLDKCSIVSLCDNNKSFFEKILLFFNLILKNLSVLDNYRNFVKSLFYPNETLFIILLVINKVIDKTQTYVFPI